MLAAYLIATIVGLGLVVASVAGVIHDGGDADASGTVDTDAGADAGDGHGAIGAHGSDLHHHFEWASWLPFLSLRFWTFALAIFGVIGLLLGALTDLGGVATLLTAIGAGAVGGSAVSAMFRASRRLETGDTASSAQLIGRSGNVVVAIRPGSIGKVRLQVQGTTEEILAKGGAHELPIGTEVLVVRLSGPVAEVLPMRELLPPEADPTLTRPTEGETA